MKDPREYLNEIKENVAKLRCQGEVTATENALFGLIDGLAGLQHATMERLAEVERRLAEHLATNVTRATEPRPVYTQV